MGAGTNWIRSILYGYREIFANGIPLIQRDVINFVGLTVLDDPLNKRTNVTFAGAYIPTDDPIANTVVSRGPSGGTSVTALSVYDAVPPTGIETAYINGATGKMYADNGFTFETTTVIRAQPYKPIYSASLYGFDGNGRLSTSTNGSSYLTFDLDIPDGAVLNDVTVWIVPAAGHAGLPATMPTVTLSEVEVEGTGTTLLASETDLSADLTAYHAAHVIVMNALSTTPLLPATIENSVYHYRVKFTSESSTNALLGCIILGIIATYTTTTYRK